MTLCAQPQSEAPPPPVIKEDQLGMKLEQDFLEEWFHKCATPCFINLSLAIFRQMLKTSLFYQAYISWVYKIYFCSTVMF